VQNENGPTDLKHVLAALRQDARFMRHVTAWEQLQPRPANLVPWPRGLDPRLVTAVQGMGIERLYSHQSTTAATALEGKHVVLATATASGKTLAYNLPVVHTLLNDPSACALYLFPTKALARDQIAALDNLIGHLPIDLPVRVYDGDTPSSQRQGIRRQARILVTNPDMLHVGILPNHTRWARLLSNLRFVVIDELHAYRGVFGGHVANVLRRLQRLCRFYGTHPTFICASATIANPRALAEDLIGDSVTLVNDDGAPRGEKHFILYNPPLVDARLGIRQSATLATRNIAARFLQADIQTIVFARARLTTEVLLGYLRDLWRSSGQDPLSIAGYRGGYLASERRAIEQGLRSGEMRGVVTTNALELGVDIGELSACVMAGYPGTVSSAWQQAGRAGRRVGESVAVLVASATPLDQYLITHPRFFFGQPVERALTDPNNLAILAQHVACAAYELPFEPGETFGGGGQTEIILDALVEEHLVHRGARGYTWIADKYPAAGLSLRSGVSDRFVIQDVSSSPVCVIGQMDRPSVPNLLHEGAIYIHAGETYVVDALDWERGVARVRATRVDYYTRSSSVTEVEILQEYATYPENTEVVLSQKFSERRAQRTLWGYGELLVTTRVTGYRKIKKYSHETLAYVPLELPAQQLSTIGCWMTLPEHVVGELQRSGILPPSRDYGPNWAQQRDAARARDGYRCRHCGTPERDGRHHDVHHITPFRTFGYVSGSNDFYLSANQLDNLVSLCPVCHRRVEREHLARGAMSGLAYLMQHLAPLYLMCDPGDLGTAVQPRPTGTKLPTATFYDSAPGGVGLSAHLFELRDELLEAALSVVAGCPCADGCPACVGPVVSKDAATKALTRELLKALLS